jgi:hypothetical protein
VPHNVYAQFDGKGTPFRVVLTTSDKDYADATEQQFREAGVPVRIEVFKSGRK